MREARKDGGGGEGAGLSPFNGDFKSQIATHERESCVLKHERHVPACRNEGEGERKRERGNNIYALGQRGREREWRLATAAANVVSSAQ